MIRLHPLLAFILLVCTATTDASASIAFSNYVPQILLEMYPRENAYNVHTGWGINGPTAFSHIPGVKAASQFLSAVTGPIDTVAISLSHHSGGSDWVVSLHEDGGASAVGPAFVTWRFAWNTPFMANDHTVVLQNDDPSKMLTAGTKYWLSVAANIDTSADLHGTWHWNSTGNSTLQHPLAGSVDNGETWILKDIISVHGVFEVNVLPEPSALALLAIAMSALTIRRRPIQTSNRTSTDFQA